MFFSRMINQNMRILKDPLGRFSNLSSSTVSARFRNLVSRTVVESHGRSSSTSSAASKLSTRSKALRKHSRDERRALVESFVTRYRATNGGRFPTLRATHKEVGGCYYIVRDIFQELKSLSKDPSVRASQIPSVQVPVAENDASSLATDEAETGGCSRIPARDSIGSSVAVSGFVSPAGDPDVVETETNQKSPVDVSVSGSDNGNHWSDDTPVIITVDDNLGDNETDMIPRSDVESRTKSISHLPGNNQRDEVSDARFENADPEEEPNISANFKIRDGQKVEEETQTTTRVMSENLDEKTETRNSIHSGGQELKQDRILEAENKAREVSDREAVDVQKKRERSVWSNIKSLAEGFINLWRKG